MAQDVREPYFDETGSTHSVSTTSDVHEQVRRNERRDLLGYSLHRFLPFTTPISENDNCLSFVFISWVNFLRGSFLNSALLVLYRAGIDLTREEYDRINRRTASRRYIYICILLLPRQ